MVFAVDNRKELDGLKMKRMGKKWLGKCSARSHRGRETQCDSERMRSTYFLQGTGREGREEAAPELDSVESGLAATLDSTRRGFETRSGRAAALLGWT